MALTRGSRLGPYEIVAAIGAGGMGEVYRARDTKLQRDVAIKILPPSFASDPDRLARFSREAQVLASLNHPGIAHIYGFVDPVSAADAGALAMEFVEGEDLAARLAAGPLPLEDALSITRQIADALEYAHDRGIVHRDLKPANVKLTSDGTVKVLDFGLAKAAETTVAGAGASDVAGRMANSPTFTSPALTHMGLILGTAAYMAPEQAKGKPVDRRADIWALGVVLFEMLTGRTLFEGETVTDTIAQVITQPPRWDLLPASTPPAVRRILRRCLEKDARNRFQAAGDVRLEIEEYLAAPAEDRVVAAPPRSRLARLAPWGLAAALGVLALIAWWRPWVRASAPPPVRLEVRLGAEQLSVDDDNDSALAVLSPDGQTIVYAGTTGRIRRLYARPLGSLESAPLAGTEGAFGHFFSPDGRWVAFFSAGTLKKVAVSGGAAVTIAPAADGRGGTWGPDDTIVFSPATTTGLQRVPAAGGTPTDVTTPQERERTHRWPWFLPGGRAVIFVRQDHETAYDDAIIEAVRLDTKERKILVRGGTYPRYLESGHLAYLREGTLFAVPFDAERLEVTGAAQPVLAGVRSSGGIGGGTGDGSSQIAFSSNGTAVYIPGAVTGPKSQLEILDRAGRPVLTFPEKREFRDPSFSPDGTRVAVQITEPKGRHIYILDTERGAFSKVTFDGASNGLPLWSPDGRELVFYSDRVPGGLNIFSIRADGGGEPVALTTGNTVTVATSISPDGRTVAGMQQSPTSLDLILVNRADGTVKPFAPTASNETVAKFSPDGKWIAYQADDAGVQEVYVRPYPGPGGKWQISTGGGELPSWTNGGRELVYLDASQDRFMAVDIAVDADALRPGKPRVLFEKRLAHPSTAVWYDVNPHGTRFVVLAAGDDAPVTGYTHVTLIFNFFDEVRRVLAGRQ